MAYWADVLALAQTSYTTRLAGGEVESYVIVGTDIKLCSLETLHDIVKDLTKLAANESAQAAGRSRLHFANLRPGG